MELDMDNEERLEQFLASLSPEQLKDWLLHYVVSLTPEVIKEWQTENHNQNLLYKLQVGDLVEFDRKMFKHWAVYVGNDEVVHMTGDSNTESVLCCPSKLKNARIRCEDFWEVAKGDWASKGNKDDRRYCPLPGEDIRRKALSYLGPADYNLLNHNCEHFAKLCRYGEARSEQAVELKLDLYNYIIRLFIFVMLCALVLFAANYSVVKMSAAFKANLLFVMSVSVAVIPLATVRNKIRLFCLNTVIVVSGGIAQVFAASTATASIIATASLVIIVMVSMNFCGQAKDLMLTTGAIIALSTVEAVNSVFGQRLVLTACTMLTALAAITTDETVALFCCRCIEYLSVGIYDYSTALEIIVLFVPLYDTELSKELVRILAVFIFLVFIVSFPLRSIINILFFFDFYNSMINVVKLNIVAILICILIKLQSESCRKHRIHTRLPFLLTLILHWVLYDPELVSQAM